MAEAAYTDLSIFAHSLLNRTSASITNGHCKDVGPAIERLGGQGRACQFSTDALICLANHLASNGLTDKAKAATKLARQTALSPAVLEKNWEVSRLIDIGILFSQLGSLGQGAETLKAANQLAQTSRDKAQIALALANLYLQQGDHTRALEFAKSCLSFAESARQSSDQTPDIEEVYGVLAECLDAAGNTAEAIDFADKQLAIAKQDQEKDPVGYVSALVQYASLVVKEGASGQAKAEAALKEAIQVSSAFRHPKDLLVLAAAKSALADLQQSQGKIDSAWENFAQATDLFRGDTSKDTAADYIHALNGLAACYWEQGKHEDARNQLFHAASLLDGFINSAFYELPFAEQCAFVNLADEQKNLLLSLANGPESISKTYTYLMRWNGLLIEALKRDKYLPEGADKDELTAIRHRRARLSWQLVSGQGGRAAGRTSDIQLELAKLTERQELESPKFSD